MSAFITGADRERIQKHLRQDEKILWCGKPEPNWWSREMFVVMQGGVMLLVLSLGLMHYREEEAYPLQVRVILTLLAVVGALCLFGAPTLRWLHRRRWLYALTTQRALLLLHNELRSYPLYPYMTERTHTPEQGLGDIVFERQKMMNLSRHGEERYVEYGFLRIRESADVLRLLREQIERNEAER